MSFLKIQILFLPKAQGINHLSLCNTDTDLNMYIRHVNSDNTDLIFPKAHSAQQPDSDMIFSNLLSHTSLN